MKAGDKVTVWEQPWSRTGKEGVATVIEARSEDSKPTGKTLVMCRVKFSGPGETAVWRKVWADDVVKKDR